MKKKSLLSAILSIVLCISLIAGSTFALFVTESDVNVAITAGNIDVTATVRDGSMKTYSYDRETKNVVEQTPAGSFSMGGSALVSKNEITLTDIVPGDKVTFTIDVVNNSTVTVMYRTSVTFINNTGLAEGLTVTANGDAISLQGKYSSWKTLDVAGKDTTGNVGAVEMVIDFPYEDFNQSEYLGKTCTVVYNVEAVQGNANITEYDENGFMIVNGVLEGISEEVYNATTVIIPDGVIELSPGLFAKAPNLTTLVIPEGVTTVPSNFCGYASNLTTVVFPSTLKSVQYKAFENTALKNATLPDGVTEIGESSFRFTALEHVTIKRGVTYGRQAYQGCTSLNTVVIEEGVTTLPESVLRRAGMKLVVIPASVTHIGDFAFRQCENLETVVILSEDITFDGSMAFSNDQAGNAPKITVYVAHEEAMDAVEAGTKTSVGTITIKPINATEKETVADTIKNAKAGDVVFVPAGEYTDIKTIPDGVTLIGEEGAVITGGAVYGGDLGGANISLADITIMNIDFTNPYGTALQVHGSLTMIDCKVTGSSGMYYSTVSTGGALVFENCDFIGDVYGLQVGEGNGDVIVRNCRISGWNTFGENISVSMSNTEFLTGQYYNYLGFYHNSVLEGCVFAPEYEIDVLENYNITSVINNCSVSNGDDIITLLLLEKEDKGEFIVDGKIIVINADKLAEVIAENTTATLALLDGTFTMPSASGKDITISGTKDTVVSVYKPNLSGTDVIFNGVTVKGSGYSTGVQHVNTVTYNDVTVVGEMCLYGEKVVFNNCTFKLAKGQYIWTYGAQEVEFNNCVFETEGKAILVYDEAAATSATKKVTVNGCTFNATASDKTGNGFTCAAVEIGTGSPFEVYFTGTNTVDEDFAGLWRDKGNEAGKDNGNRVTVDGKTVASTSKELQAAINSGVSEIVLQKGEYTADLYVVPANRNLTIIGQGADTKLNFSNQQVRLALFDSLTISNCTIERMATKGWGHLVFGSSETAGGVYTLSNCIFNGVGTQGIYINQNVAATFNIENCTFNGDFGSEGAITIQNKEVDITVNVNDCDFNDIPATSHEICVLYSTYDGWTLNADGVTAYWKVNQ